MPIRPENRSRYPADWRNISDSIRFGRANCRCECAGECGRGHFGRCHRRHDDQLTDRADGPRVVLTTAHLDHTPENCDPSNLRAMCQGCHLHYDRDHHARTAAATRQRQRTTGMAPLILGAEAVMYPTQLAAEAMAAEHDLVWDDLLPDGKQHYLDLADAACKGIVAGEEGEARWRIVKTDARGDGLIYVDARDEVVDISEEWSP
jgi:hypothetical protein